MDYSVRKVEEQSPDMSRYEISLASPQRNPRIELDLEASTSEAEETINIAVLDVVGAVRQYGRVRVFARSDLRLIGILHAMSHA